MRSLEIPASPALSLTLIGDDTRIGESLQPSQSGDSHPVLDDRSIAGAYEVSAVMPDLIQHPGAHHKVTIPTFWVCLLVREYEILENT
jgi:hypothetical protein